ncbi:MAG: right-handed parallel beta-helix repeat-containing protein [Solirubrobacterales bacterium]
MRRVSLILCLAGVALGAQASAAFATQYFVNGTTGADTNTCLQPTVGSTSLGPCKTIGQALTLGQSNPGPDEVLVADGTYAETLTVGDGTLLRSLDTTDPKPVINNSSLPDDNAVTIPSTGGSVDRFEIRSGFRPLSVAGPASVTNNSFPTTAAITSNQDVFLTAVTGSVLIAGNGFSDDGSGTQQGIFSNATSATNLTIQNNDFSGLNIGIWLQDGNSSPLIAGNEITGVHGGGWGVLVYEGSPEIRNNTIDAPGTPTHTGIALADINGPTGATLSRNTISGLSSGVAVTDTSLSVRLNSDLITDSAGFGLDASEGDPGTGDVIATNVTIYDNANPADIRLDDNALTLDSSIVGNAILDAGTTTTCAITFSRGPTLIGPASGCGSFQTLADPMFIGGGNYHLMGSSPMIDAGETLAPPPGTLDLDGNPRALSGTPACTLMAGRRDIGADEFVPATGVGCPQPPQNPVVPLTPTPTSTPATTPVQAKRKCKKKKKKKRRGAAAAKKRCKKKR